MVELLFVACLSGAPAECRERSLLYTDITPMTCMMAAQPELAKWVSTHPKWRIRDWKCRHLRRAEHEA